MGASTRSPRHWFASQLQELGVLLTRHEMARAAVVVGEPSTEAAERQARDAFLLQLRTLCVELGEREGVTGAVVSHDGLALEVTGDLEDHDAMAAMAQVCLAAARQTTISLKMGDLGQLVIIGDSEKFALFAVGDFTIAISSPIDVSLAQALA